MFDALKGLKEALAAKERLPEPRKELAQDAAEELNQLLCSLNKGTSVTVVYYCKYQQEYHQITGIVSRVDHVWKTLYIGNVGVDFDELFAIRMCVE